MQSHKFTIGKCYIFKRGLSIPQKNVNSLLFAPQLVPSMQIPSNGILVGYTVEDVLYLPKDWRSWILDITLNKKRERGIHVEPYEKEIEEGKQIYFHLMNLTNSPVDIIPNEEIFSIDIEKVIKEERKTKRSESNSNSNSNLTN